MIKVVLVDDQNLVRSGIKGLLDLTEDIRVISEASDANQAVALISANRPDVVLLDLRMPGRSGLDVLQDLVQHNALCPTILLTTFDDDEALLEGMRLGAKGFLLKDISLERLTDAIRTVAAGQTLFRPHITDRIVNQLTSAPSTFPKAEVVEPLTGREVEILRLMAGGFNNKEIADALYNSEGTIKNHISNILSKFGVRDRVRAVLRGVELGYI